MITLKPTIIESQIYTHPAQTGVNYVEYNIPNPMPRNPDQILLLQRVVGATHFERASWAGIDVDGSAYFGFDSRWELDDVTNLKIRVYRISGNATNIKFKFIWLS